MEADRRMGIKLRNTKADAAVLKILRQYFPSIPLSEMKGRIVGHEYIFSCDGGIAGRKLLAKLEKELEQANIQADLYEEWTGSGGMRKTAPLSREHLYNSLHRYTEISRQVDRDIDHEADV